MQIVSNLRIKMLLFTLSNAFLKSVNITSVWELETKYSMMDCLKIAKSVTVNRLLQNPSRSYTNIFLKIGDIFRDISFENIFVINHMFEIYP